MNVRFAVLVASMAVAPAAWACPQCEDGSVVYFEWQCDPELGAWSLVQVGERFYGACDGKGSLEGFVGECSGSSRTPAEGVAFESCNWAVEEVCPVPPKLPCEVEDTRPPAVESDEPVIGEMSPTAPPVDPAGGAPGSVKP